MYNTDEKTTYGLGMESDNTILDLKELDPQAISLFHEAARKGDVSALKSLIEPLFALKSTAKYQNEYYKRYLEQDIYHMVYGNDSIAFRNAAESRHLEALKYIVSITDFAAWPHNVSSPNDEVVRYLRDLQNFRESVQTNDLVRLDKLLGIERIEGKIVKINDENRISDELVNKANNFVHSKDWLKGSKALLTEFLEIVEKRHQQHSERFNNLNEHFPAVLRDEIMGFCDPKEMPEENPAPVMPNNGPTSIVERAKSFVGTIASLFRR